MFRLGDVKKKEANINAEDNDKNTPLHWAVRMGFENIADLLLKYGANINAEDIYKKTPLHWAAYEVKL